MLTKVAEPVVETLSPTTESFNVDALGASQIYEQVFTAQELRDRGVKFHKNGVEAGTKSGTRITACKPNGKTFYIGCGPSVELGMNANQLTFGYGDHPTHGWGLVGFVSTEIEFVEESAEQIAANASTTAFE